MSKPFRPMLACNCDVNKLTFGGLNYYFASPKIDGVRAVVRDDVVYSRSNKPIPNQYVQRMFGYLNGMDGELIVGLPYDKNCYSNTVSGVMTANNYPDVTFAIFDTIDLLDMPYHKRLMYLIQGEGCVVVKQTKIDSLESLERYEADCLKLGYEGVMLRHPSALYKQGRGTMGDQCLMKVKRFADDEAVVIGYAERMHNANEAVVNELGYTDRTSHQENMVGCGDLGALIVQKDGVTFNIGTGFTQKQREELWSVRDALVGKLVKYKHFPVGVVEKPRHPVFLGFRDPIDM